MEPLVYILAFTVVLGVSAAYFAAARGFGRRGREPYACGERGSVVDAVKPPYVRLVLLMCIVEACVFASLAGLAFGAGVAAAAPLLVVGVLLLVLGAGGWT